MSTSPIHLAFSINDSYAEHLCVSLTSLLLNNPSSSFVVHVIGSALDENSRRKLRDIVKCFHFCSLEFHGVNAERFSNFPLHIDYISIETWFRCLLPDLLPDVEKILYLDADVIVNGDINELWNTDIAGYYAAGVEDLQVKKKKYKEVLGFSDDEIYVNAGVLLLNLTLMRRDRKVDDLFAVAGMGTELAFQDQDVLNMAFRGHVKALDSIWNFASINAKRERSKCKNARIIHFTGSRKPWHSQCKNQLKRIYFKYTWKYWGLIHQVDDIDWEVHFPRRYPHFVLKCVWKILRRRRRIAERRRVRLLRASRDIGSVVDGGVSDP